MKNLTLERVASGRAVLWSFPFWALVAPGALDELFHERNDALPVELSIRLTACLALALLSWALLRPLMRAMLLSLHPGVATHDAPRRVPGVMGTFFMTLEGDPWWVRYLLTAPIVWLISVAAFTGLLFVVLEIRGGSLAAPSGCWIPAAGAALVTLVWAPLSRRLWESKAR
jgi:hypothetical protein